MGETVSFLKTIEQGGLKPLFSDEDLKVLFHDQKSHFIHNGISRGLHSGRLYKLRRGLYVLSNASASLSRMTIANQLYSPSYISFESALSYHGLIPEAVYTVTSACLLNKKKIYQTSLGVYSFEYSPCKPFFSGVDKNDQGCLIANPLRALFDLISLRKKKYSSLIDLESDLRIDLDGFKTALAGVTVKEIIDLADAYHKKTVSTFSTLLIRELK
jgi:hypothetical protein